RVAEGGGLLNRCTVKSCTQGSNPCLSARLPQLRDRLSSMGDASRWLALHPLGDFDSKQVQRAAQSFAHGIDQVEKKPLPGRIRLAQDAVMMVKIVESLRQPEG